MSLLSCTCLYNSVCLCFLVPPLHSASCLNPIIHWVAFSRSLSEAMDTLYDLYFYCELALETWAKGFSINPLGVHDLCHAHSLASLQCSGLSNQWTLLDLKSLIEDSNLQVYMYCVLHDKEPQEPPEHTSEHVKSQNFLGACPQILFAQFIFRGPTFCICPGPPQSSRQPWPY